MTTSRGWLLAVLWAGAAATLQAQTTPAPAPAATAASGLAQPKDLPWAVAEFDGPGDWSARLPQLLTRGWKNLPDHKLTEDEKMALRRRFLDATLQTLDQQSSQLVLGLDKKRLLGPLPSTEPEATVQALATLEKKIAEAKEGKTAGAEAPATLAFRAVWPTEGEPLPWNPVDGATLAAQAKVFYTVTGSFRSVAGYLWVHVRLYSDLERRFLAEWEGRFAVDEAGAKMTEAADSLREALLGRPWSGLSIASPVTGAQVKVGKEWHILPWTSDDLGPGTLDLVVRQPGRPQESRTVTLLENQKVVLNWEPLQEPADKLVLETEPPGVSLYLDSRYLGPSPQTVDRPLTVARVRAQAPGWETLAWDVDPSTPSPSRHILSPPRTLRSVSQAKDDFYLSLAAFSFSLTTSAFAGAWSSEQVDLVNAYALAGDQTGFDKAYSRYQWINNAYGASIVLTTGLAIWMIFFTLQDYLNAAQASLP